LIFSRVVRHEARVQSELCRRPEKIKDKELLKEVQELIEATESAHGSVEIPHLEKLRVNGRYYRVKLGDYRTGLIVEGNIVTFVRFLHRSEIYRYFP